MFIIFLLYDWTTQEIQIYIYLILYLTQFCNLINKQKSFNPPIGLSENSRRSRKLLDFQSLKDEYVCTDYPTSPSSSTFESRICHVIYLQVPQVNRGSCVAIFQLQVFTIAETSLLFNVFVVNFIEQIQWIQEYTHVLYTTFR